jgi:hypothetical protein
MGYCSSRNGGIMQTIMIQVRFTEDTPYGEYSDSIYFTQDEYNSIKQDGIDKIKQDRVGAWIERIKNPPTPIEPTKKQLEEEQVVIEEQIASLQERKTGVINKISFISTKIKGMDLGN